MADNDNRLEDPGQGDDGPVLIFTSPDNDDPPEQKEDIFKYVYQPNKNDASGNLSDDLREREKRDPISNEQESKTPLTNQQENNENEIDYGQNAAAIIITPTSMPSRL